MKKGNLYLVSIPIGHKDDITLRAINTLKSVDVIVAEEDKSVRKLFHDYDCKKEYYILNEHNEEDDAAYVSDFLEKGENVALVSDCGTPVFADPGQKLVARCYQRGIRVIPIPGASSLMSALVVASFNIKKFYFAGFLPKTSDERLAEMKNIYSRGEVTVMMETPYRIVPFFQDLAKIFHDRKLTFVYKVTMPEERIICDYPEKILSIIEKDELKGEFVVIADGNHIEYFDNNKNTKSKGKYKKIPYKKKKR